MREYKRRQQQNDLIQELNPGQQYDIVGLITPSTQVEKQQEDKAIEHQLAHRKQSRVEPLAQAKEPPRGSHATPRPSPPRLWLYALVALIAFALGAIVYRTWVM